MTKVHFYHKLDMLQQLYKEDTIIIYRQYIIIYRQRN